MRGGYMRKNVCQHSHPDANNVLGRPYKPALPGSRRKNPLAAVTGTPDGSNLLRGFVLLEKFADLAAIGRFREQFGHRSLPGRVPIGWRDLR